MLPRGPKIIVKPLIQQSISGGLSVQEALLPQMDRAMRYVSQNLVICCTIVWTNCTRNPQLVEVIELERYGRRTPVNCVISVVSQRARRSIVYGYFASAAVAVDSSHMTASLSDSWSRPNPSYYCGGMYPKKHTGLFVVHTVNFLNFWKSWIYFMWIKMCPIWVCITVV